MWAFVLRESSRTGVAFANFLGRKTICWSFPWGKVTAGIFSEVKKLMMKCSSPRVKRLQLA